MAVSKYFTVTVKPDVVNGDISDIIANDKTDKPFANRDLLFDWTAFDIPKGAAKLESIVAYVMGEDGGHQTDTDIHLLLAKSENTEAPTSLGDPNTGMSAGFDMPTHLIGGVKLEGTTEGQGTLVGPAFGQIYMATPNSANGVATSSMIVEGEPDSGTNVGYDKLYIAGFAGGAIDFSTGVLLNDAEDVADGAGTSLTVDGTDPRKCFQVGDTAYIHDVDTAIGTVASMTSTTIVLESNNVGAIANNDEFINANPIRIILGFSR
jgi:hypothetical protein